MHHLFQRIVGVTPAGYLLDHRLTLAKQLLEETDWTVTPVGASVGFVSSAHFSTVFRKRLGQAPSASRNHGQISDADVSRWEGV